MDRASTGPPCDYRRLRCAVAEREVAGVRHIIFAPAQTPPFGVAKCARYKYVSKWIKDRTCRTTHHSSDMSLVTRHSVETPNFAESFLNTLKSRAKDGDSAHLDMSTVISHRKTVSTALKDLEPSFTKALSNFTSDIGLESGGAINFKWTDTIKSHPELHKAFVAFRNVSDDVDDTLSALTFSRDTTQKPTKEERDLLSVKIDRRSNNITNAS